MRWKPKDHEEWSRWFAWHPVMTEDGTLVWLERVDRRYKFYLPMFGGWEYR